MRKFVQALLFSGVMFAAAAPSSAATLTITDTFGGSDTIWTLTVETGCVTCDVTLTGFFQDEAGADQNAYAGTYLDSVQWVISNPNVNPETVDLTSTTAGATTDWDFDIDENLSANGCGGGAADAVCGEWISGGSGSGFGPIVNGSTLTWNFETTFASALPDTLVAGNIRAAFNTINPNNGKVKNYNIFSPDGGVFQTSSTTTTTPATTTTATPAATTTTPATTTTTSGTVPEPTLLSLLGVGLAIAGARMRRKSS